MAGYGVAIKNSFLNLVPPRVTDWRFKSPPHPIHTRYAQLPDRLKRPEKLINLGYDKPAKYT